MGLSKNRLCIIIGLVCVVTFVVGFLIGHFTVKNPVKNDTKDDKESENLTLEQLDNKHVEIMNTIDAAKIEGFHKYFTKHPHIAGSARNKELAEYIGNKFKEYKFDRVEYPRYEVLLSKLPPGKTSVVQILSRTDPNNIIVNVSGTEPTAEPSENDPTLPAPYLGYSANGTVFGEPVYVNYGRYEDFEMLNNTYGISVKNKIAIMRFGKNYRGAKVDNAAKYGAIGAIIFNDPAQYAPLGVNETYPKTWWLPGSSAQRGSIFMKEGDPLTYGLPSVQGTFRVPWDEANLPTIPAYPMNYGEAIKFMSRLGGSPAPDDWQGGLPGVKYNLGPGFTDTNLQIKMEINNEAEVEPIYNVIGTVIGREEPDRYVLIGNHRDAWNFGGVDASSGTASMMEIARAVAEQLKTGWRPRRTLKFCSWDGEEFALIGSTEWVEENSKLISDRVVSYINVDISCNGKYSFRGQGSPVFRNFIFEAAKNVEDPNTKGESMYEVWAKRVPSKTVKGEPEYAVSGAGSDYAPFFHYLGMSIMDLTYMFKSKNVSFYPVYHSNHDTYNWVKKFIDPNFHCMRSVSKLGSRLLLRLADLPLLPFVMSPFVKEVEKKFNDMKKHHGTQFKHEGITLQHLNDAIDQLKLAALDFDSNVAKIDPEKESFYKLRMVNDQMMQFERTFVEPAGIPGNGILRHVIFAGSTAPESYGFHAVSDLLFDIDVTGNWREVKKQLSFLTSAINLAAKSLQDIK